MPDTGRIITHEELNTQFPHKVGGDSSCSVTGLLGVMVYFLSFILLLFKPDRKHRDHLLQSLLHLRIHAALQKIEQNSVSMGRPQVVRGKEFVQNGTQNELQIMNSEEMTESDDFFDAEEKCANLCRQDSNSSFDIISDFSDEV